jgi:Ca2+-dependent lipid-binding protein
VGEIGRRVTFVCCNLRRNEPKTLKTDVAEPTHNPIWNATFEVPNVPAESLMKMNIDISVWDYCPDRDSQFLGAYYIYNFSIRINC